MGGNERFFYFFGGIWLFVGLSFIGASIGVPLFAGPEQLNADGPPVWVFGLVGLAVAGAGALIIGFARRAAEREKRLMEVGETHEATVIDIRQNPVQINRRIRWNVLYRYDFEGRPLEGKSRAMFGPEVVDFKPGQTVTIMVDPAKPQDSLMLDVA
jgi:hypothetical protein